MAATADQGLEELRRANAELQQRLEEAVAQRDESEAQKAAIAEVLEVINSSPSDLAPVFGAILEKALNVCEKAFGSLARFDGEAFDWVATHGVPEAWFAEFRASGYRPTPAWRYTGSNMAAKTSSTWRILPPTNLAVRPYAIGAASLS